ncbi:MAG: polysaccharide biosynthesis/export family protein, partial [Proteobacteria bacterium]|nr:polysaccharide biosynthesis/export family protein [Pseudomonadota bacterium]
MPFSRLTTTRSAILLLALATLQACATLPSSGPTGGAILKDATGVFDIRSLEKLGDVPTVEVAAHDVPQLDLAAPFRRSDAIGPGDLLEISVYEVGVALFGGSGARLTEQGFDPSARAERLPPVRVGDDGFVVLPYVGRLYVDGVSTLQLQDTIRNRLKSKSQEPQVLVRLAENNWNSVVVGGEVARPGRIGLTAKHESLGELLAIAGGYKGEPSDLVVRFNRGKISFEQRLSEAMAGTLYGQIMFAGDYVELLRKPQTFSVLGAAGRIEELPFNKADVSLAEAIARAGGSSENQGDPAAIFVFRSNGMDKPTVFHLNLMRAEGYFIAQRFMMKDKDIVYFGNARANAP